MFNKLTRSLEIALRDRASSFILEYSEGGPDEEGANIV
jgi:hypothetical protein